MAYLRKPTVKASVLNAKTNAIRSVVRSSTRRPAPAKLASASIKRMQERKRKQSYRETVNNQKRLEFEEEEDSDDTTDAYADQQYWDERYAKGEEIQKEFEWFLRYEDVEPVLQTVLDYNDRTAMFIDLGCGTSLFLRDLKRSGYQGACLGLDYSKTAIDTMRAREDCKGIDFAVCDATQVDGKVKLATAILDKSLMDAMLHAKDESVAEGMLQSVARSVKPDGIFIQITQLDPRKPEGLKFLHEVVLENLCSGRNKVSSVTAHLSSPSPNDQAREVPSVLVYKFGVGARGREENANVEVEIVEYEPSEDGQ